MPFNQRVLSALAALAIALGCSLPATADDGVYDNSARFGVYSVFYHTSADDLQGPYVPAGVNFKAKDVETLYLGYVRRLYGPIQVELALGYPPLSKVEGRGPAAVGSVPYNGQTVSSARWLSPTVLFEYQFLPENFKFHPYIGVGVNYTAFYDRFSTAQGNAGLGGPTRLSLTSSVGPAATIGASYAFSARWHLYTSYSISRVNTNIIADTDGVERTTEIKFGPQAWVISAGYSF